MAHDKIVYRVLAVDDDPKVLETYREVLSPAGNGGMLSEIQSMAGDLFDEKKPDASDGCSFDLVLCRQGDEALKAANDAIAEGRPFSLAFVDVRMPPGPDGIWAAEQIRKRDQDIEIVMVTAYSDTPPHEIARRVPPEHKLLFIQKPFHPKEISHFAYALSSKWNSELEVRKQNYAILRINLQLEREILERQKAEISLKNSKECLKAILESATEAIITINDRGVIVSVNRAFERIFGYTIAEAMGANVKLIVPSPHKEAHDRHIQNYLRTGKAGMMGIGREITAVRKDGVRFPIYISMGEVLLSKERLFTAIVQDITQRKEIEEKVQTLTHAVEQSGCAVIITDLSGVMQFVNQAFTRITGYTPEEAVGKSVNILKSGRHPPEFYYHLWKTIASKKMWKGQFINKKKDGSLYWEAATISPVVGQSGQITHYISVKEDITLQKEAEDALAAAYQRLRKLASLDGLTQVANRRKFDEHLDQEWLRCQREKLPLCLLMGDIDYFKRYNDTYGHQAGDTCLKQVARAMEKSVRRPADILARYGGEEFAAILPNTDIDGARHIAKKIQDAVKSLNIPHIASSADEFVTLSIGGALLIPNGNLSPDRLIKIADEALYLAKEQGRNRFVMNEQPGD